jgi:predicted nucleic acid-binding Zn ribbon protein
MRLLLRSAAMTAHSQAERDEFDARFPSLPKHRRLTPIAPRREMMCPGCGEPIFVSPDLRWSLQLCSLRCYQRVYRRQRRKNGGSTIEWKGGMRNRCASCKKPIDGKRPDAKFCSNKCKQWHYRRRHAG